MRKTLHYRIFCKYCEDERTYEIDERDMVFGGFRLNCHRCNNYAIFISPDEKTIRENCRGIGRGRHYFDGKSKELMDAPPKWEFEWREPK